MSDFRDRPPPERSRSRAVPRLQSAEPARRSLLHGLRCSARASLRRLRPRAVARLPLSATPVVRPIEASSAAPAPETSERDPRAYTPKHLAQRILTSRSALEGERKRVTVLFADLAGFTSLSESRDPEEMHALMDRFFQLVLNEVHRFEGTVNQFLGDGAMALFGAPVALEDAPRRAVSAALAIQRGLAALGEETASQRRAALALRIGIHSGHVVVGRIGDDLRMDYTAVGDTTNLAARLQQLAPPGEVLISEATQRLVAGFFEFEDLGASDRARQGRARARIPGGGGAPGQRPDRRRRRFRAHAAGRAANASSASLHAAFEAAREGHGRACFLVGEAGIGKSRLLSRVPHASRRRAAHLVRGSLRLVRQHHRLPAHRRRAAAAVRHRRPGRRDRSACQARARGGVAGRGSGLDTSLSPEAAVAARVATRLGRGPRCHHASQRDHSRAARPVPARRGAACPWCS